MEHAPLLRSTMGLCADLLESLEAISGSTPLRRHLAEVVLRLLDHVTLAVERHDRLESLREADAALAVLRVHLTLALELELLDEEAFIELVEQADGIGRQIGGWLRQLGRYSE